MQLIIIAGMHRSFTSFLTQYLSKCGVFLGSNLLEPEADNKDGYFENSTIVRIQNSIIYSKGYNIFNCDNFTSFSNEEKKNIQEEINKLILENTNLPIAIKDPRNTLFLNAWDELYPNAKYIFIFRDYLEVIDSLLRRNTDMILKYKIWLLPISWLSYNHKLLDFYLKNNHNTIFLSKNILINNYPKVINEINKKLDLKLTTYNIKKIYKPNLTNTTNEISFLAKIISYPFKRKLIKLQNSISNVSI